MEFANAFMQCAQGPGPSWAAHQPMHYPPHAGQMPPQTFYPPPHPNYPSMSVPPYQPQLPNQPPPMPFPHQYPMPFQGINVRMLLLALGNFMTFVLDARKGSFSQPSLRHLLSTTTSNPSTDLLLA